MQDALLPTEQQSVDVLSEGLMRTVNVGQVPAGGLQDAPPPPPLASVSAASVPGEQKGRAPPLIQHGNCRFWLMTASYSLSWFTLSWPGFTSPVLATDCDGCPECLNCELHLNAHGQSMFLVVPGFIGLGLAMLAGPLIDRVGRKPGLIAGNLITVAGWAVLALTPLPARNEQDEPITNTPLVIVWLVVGRLLSTAGAVGMTIPV